MKDITKEILLWTGVVAGSLGTVVLADTIFEQVTLHKNTQYVQESTQQVGQSFEDYQNNLAANILFASVALGGTIYLSSVAYEIGNTRRQTT